jgi:hypothetical protein
MPAARAYVVPVHTSLLWRQQLSSVPVDDDDYNDEDDYCDDIVRGAKVKGLKG